MISIFKFQFIMKYAEWWTIYKKQKQTGLYEKGQQND